MARILELLDAGVKLYETIGPTAYLVRMPALSVMTLASRSYIRWLGNYKPEYKFNADSKSKRGGTFIYTLGDDSPEFRADLNRLGVTLRGYDTSAHFYEVTLSKNEFPQIAETLWWIKGITEEPETRLHSLNFEPDDSREMICSFQSPFIGSGVNVGAYDTGIWTGNTFDFPSGSINSLGGWQDANGHGTHVSGIIAARGGRNIEGVNDAKGVAPASVINMVSGVGGTGGNYSYSTAFTYFSNRQAQVSNHSWGFMNNYTYEDNTKNIDGYADNNDMVIVFSAGNDGSLRTIGNPGTGKNVVTVGALNYVTTGSEVLGTRASYSSQGPTLDDSRQKPDLVAPGGGISNGYAQGIVSTNNSDTMDDGSNTWPTDFFYTRISGTSQAAPHVTGVLATMKEWDPAAPSEPLKAVLINHVIAIKANSSDALAGYANTAVGYGLVNAFSPTQYYIGESDQLLNQYDWGGHRVGQDKRLHGHCANWNKRIQSHNGL